MKTVRTIYQFLRFVWRESPGSGRVSIKTAWAIACIFTRKKLKKMSDQTLTPGPCVRCKSEPVKIGDTWYCSNPDCIASFSIKIGSDVVHPTFIYIPKKD